MMRRRSLFSLAALLAPGAFDRIAEAAIASEPEIAPEPARERVVAIGPALYKFTAGPSGLDVAVAERAEVFRDRPEPVPLGHRVYRGTDRTDAAALSHLGGFAAEIVWPSDPSRSCRRCRYSCNASLMTSGEWGCHIIGIKEDYAGPPLTAEAPGFLGYYGPGAIRI